MDSSPPKKNSLSRRLTLFIASSLIASISISIHLTITITTTTRDGFSMPITRTCDTCSNNRSALVSQLMNQPRLINRPAAATTEVANDVDVIARFIGDGDEHAEVELVVDTGSEILWSLNKSPQGRLTCKKSKSLFCHDPRFRQEYGGGLHTEGFLVRDKILLRTLRGPLLDLGEITFGCNYLAVGDDQTKGIIGLSRGPLSLIQQLGILRFSHCIPQPGKTGALRFGSHAIIDEGSITPFTLVSQRYPFYYIGVRSITVGNTRLNMPNDIFRLKAHGRGGFIVDSGTWFTRLISPVFHLLVEEVRHQMMMLGFTISPGTGSRCYKKPRDEISKLPTVKFRFNPNVIVVLGADQVFRMKPSVICLAFSEETEQDGISIFGAFQMTNYEVGYDIVRGVSFKPKECSL
ncbi:aspartic proteinase nepenthesin-2-like [Arachis hypogaea]|uniref:aspartic proteinase nepenthesin-2-like n=2 Tax=Arachis hypogaea TaxID=3818 RepID=UPI003B212165